MAASLLPKYSSFLVLLLLPIAQSLDGRAKGAPSPLSFSFDRFGKSPTFSSEIALTGDAEVVSSAVMITRPAMRSSGGIAYRKPISLLGANPGFSTSFSFSISQGNGDGLAFSLFPSSVSPDPQHGLPFGQQPSVISVKFVTLMKPNSSDSTLGIRNPNCLIANAAVNSRKKQHSWIDYDGIRKRIEVRVGESGIDKPADALVSYPVDLSKLLAGGKFLLGLSSSNGNSTQATCIYSWSFSSRVGTPYAMHSEPFDPHSIEGRPTHPRRPHYWAVVAAALAAVCSILLLWYAVVAQRPAVTGECPLQLLPMDAGYQRIALVDDEAIREC